MYLKKIGELFLQNTLQDYALFLLFWGVATLVVKLADALVLSRLTCSRPAYQFLLTALKKSALPVLYFAAFYAPISGLALHPAIFALLQMLGITVLTYCGIGFLLTSINFLPHLLAVLPEQTGNEHHIKAAAPMLKILIWLLGLIFLLDNLGFQISAVVAGLGIGGIAIALAAQAMLGDLFSYFAIIFDRPFEIGDLITINEHTGTIEHIGIKTTRIRSLSGEQLVFSNSNLTASHIRNYKRMSNRRIVFHFRVTYDTPCDQLRKIPLMVQQIIEEMEATEFDRAHFSQFGKFSLEFETVYYVSSSDYRQYMDIQQEVNLRIKAGLENQGIQFAYLSQAGATV